MSDRSKPDPTRVKIAWQDPVMMQIGKAGLSEGVIKETKRLLKEHQYIKIRLLRSAGGSGPAKKGIFSTLCSETDAVLVGIRGNTAVVFRPKGRR